MLRRNLLKSLTAIIPLSLLNKNANANLFKTTNCEENKLNTTKIDPDYTWEIQIKNKDGRIVKVERSDGWWGESTYDEHGKELNWKDSTGRFYEYIYDNDGTTLLEIKGLYNKC